MVYKANKAEIEIPCVKTTSNSNLYWAKFKVLNTDPFVMELVNVGEKNDNIISTE